jgi:hypothetical protein
MDKAGTLISLSSAPALTTTLPVSA